MWCRSSGEMIPPDINSTFISAVCIMHKVTFGLNDSTDMYNFLMLCHSTCSELVPGYKHFWAAIRRVWRTSWWDEDATLASNKGEAVSLNCRPPLHHRQLEMWVINKLMNGSLPSALCVFVWIWSLKRPERIAFVFYEDDNGWNKYAVRIHFDLFGHAGLTCMYIYV